MPKRREHSEPTRQIYASIREDIYLAAKTRAAELRLPMRRFIEDALELAINPNFAPATGSGDAAPAAPPSIWDDQYIDAQAKQPLGSPLALSEDEARRVALGAFGVSDYDGADNEERLGHREQGDVGDPVDMSDEDAAKIAREAFSFGAVGVREE